MLSAGCLLMCGHACEIRRNRQIFIIFVVTKLYVHIYLQTAYRKPDNGIRIRQHLSMHTLRTLRNSDSFADIMQRMLQDGNRGLGSHIKVNIHFNFYHLLTLGPEIALCICS